MGGRKKPFRWEVKENGCWECISHTKDKDGYARVRNHYATTFLHRYIYEECFGFITNGLIVRHKCDNPSCINPEHLELGTYKDNAQDREKRGRSNPIRGENNNFSKLKKKDIEIIKNMYKVGKTQYEIASEFKLSQGHISNIINGKRWSHEK